MRMAWGRITVTHGRTRGPPSRDKRGREVVKTHCNRVELKFMVIIMTLLRVEINIYGVNNDIAKS